MLVVRLVIRGRGRGASLFREMGGRRTAADARNGMKLRKYKGNDRVNACARSIIVVTCWLEKSRATSSHDTNHAKMLNVKAFLRKGLRG